MGKSLQERFLTVFGDILVYHWPLFVLYNPEGYQVKGEDVREVLAVLRPGDILVRSYRHYLDGKFIPGCFSHVGLYLGEVTEADRSGVETLSPRFLPGTSAGFKTGKQMVLHALAEGVRLEDVLNFCRCDAMAVLRFPERLAMRRHDWKCALPEGAFHPSERKILRALRSGKTVSFRSAFPIIKRTALGKLGVGYDFDFDFARFDRLSCSELVYFATKCLGPFLGITPAEHRFFGFLKHTVIEPDAFVRSPLKVVWGSRSIDRERFPGYLPETRLSKW